MRRGVMIGLAIGSLVGGTAGATILTASEHGSPTTPTGAPTGQVHAATDYDSSSAT